MFTQFCHVLGTFVILLSVAFLLSEEKRRINPITIFLGIFWQIIFTIVILKIPAITKGLMFVNEGLKVVTDSSTKASSLVFGNLATPTEGSEIGFILALQGLPVLIVISAFSSLLIYLRILPLIIKVLSLFFRNLLQIGGTLGVAVSANIFTGMSETPLVITPYLKHLSRSELFSLMTCGTACIASSVMVLLDMIMRPVLPNAIIHIISATLISIPISLTISRLIVPPSDKDKFTDASDVSFTDIGHSSLIESVFTGIINGSKVVVTIIAMLIGFVAIIDIINEILSVLPSIKGHTLSIQLILGVIMRPLSWLIGIPMEETQIAASLLGSKIAFNEIIAFQQMADIGSTLSNRTIIMMIYALCSFANFGSIGVMAGIYGALVPERRKEVLQLGVKSVIAGVISNLLNASLVGLFLSS